MNKLEPGAVELREIYECLDTWGRVRLWAFVYWVLFKDALAYPWRCLFHK